MNSFYKYIFTAIFLTIGLFSLTACSGGEADYSLEEVQSGMSLDLALLSSSRITVDNTEIIITTVRVQSKSDVTYRLIGGDPESQYFDINATTGELRFVSGFDPEPLINEDKYYILLLEISNTDNEKITEALEVKVVRDIKTIPPEIRSRDLVSMSGYNIDVLIVEGYTASQTQLHYNIVNVDDAVLFQIDALNGSLQFKSAPNDFDPNNATVDRTYNLTVEVTDSNDIPLSSAQAITVNVFGDKTKIPPELLTEGPIYTKEGSVNVVTFVGGHSRVDAVLTYYMLVNQDSSVFTLDSSTGVLVFNDIPDYETDAWTYYIDVYVEDELANKSATITYRIDLKNVDETPYFIPDTSTLKVDVTTGATYLVTMKAESALEIAVLTYSIDSSYQDASMFKLDPITHELSFINPVADPGFFPDYYYAKIYVSDQFGNNEYQNVDVKVSR